MENGIIALESRIEKLTERITMLENLTKCENCKNVIYML